MLSGSRRRKGTARSSVVTCRQKEMAETDRKNAAEGNSSEVIEAVNHLTIQLLTPLIDGLRKELAAPQSESGELSPKRDDTSDFEDY
ncbi:hypothetical protein M513_05211 [Trichuris suis]|uniref:Uncharacterized protein n=1 Tax=Trichuris suis TaxID=68888 RepID=A0A085M9P8_9BILA|nr:hypothetical protein M513_05211 [Trichuris suis]